MMHKHTFIGEKEKRIIFFGRTIESGINPDQLNEATKADLSKPAKAPGAASRERVRGAQKDIEQRNKNYNERVIQTMKIQFAVMTRPGGVTGAEAKATLEMQNPKFEVELNGEKIVDVKLKNPNAPQTAPTKSDDLMSGLGATQKPIVERALNELQNAAPQTKQHMVEFLSDAGKSNERIVALGEIQQLVDRLKPEARDRIAPYLASIADGDFSSIDVGVQARDFVAISLQALLGDPTKRETVVFTATIFKDIATGAPSRSARGPGAPREGKNEIDKPGTAQDELDKIMADPDMSPATREQQIGMVMFNYGVEVREENGKLVAKEADPKQKFGELINRFSGFIRFVTALVGSLKSSVDEVKNSIAGKAGLNTSQNAPQNKAELDKGTQDDPVNPDIRKELKDDPAQTVPKMEDELKLDNPPTTKYSLAVNKRNQARTEMNTASDAVRTLKERLGDEERDVQSNPDDAAKKDKVLATKREIRDAEKEVEKKTDQLNDAQEDLTKLETKKTALENSKKKVSDMNTELNKKRDDLEKVLDVDNLRDVGNAKGLLTVLKNTTLKMNDDFLRIQMVNKDDLLKIKDIAKKYPSVTFEDSMIATEGRNDLVNPRAFVKLLESLVPQIAAKPDA